MPRDDRFFHLALCLTLAGCNGERAPPPPESAPPKPAPVEQAGEAYAFVEVAAEAGLDFVHWNGMVGALDYPEMLGSGVALLDFDGDGDLDLFLVQGNLLRPERSAEAVFPPPGSPPLTGRLYRNDSIAGTAGRRSLLFTDVTAASGLAATAYGMGAAAADFDNDGDVDLYLTSLATAKLGANQLWENRGDGTFRDATAGSGATVGRWSVPAVPLDFDRDGWLDLFVGNYLVWDPATDPDCKDELGLPNYCGPLAFPAQPDTLLRNRGRARGGPAFSDVTREAGLTAAFGGALGAVAADFDGDGQLDLFVGNDGTPNQLWMNRGAESQPRFVNRAAEAGCAWTGQGHAQASMGVSAADYDGDGDEDLWVVNLTGESDTLYANEGHGNFGDHSLASGLGTPTYSGTGFGTALFDYDNDGWLDVFVAHGAVKVINEQRLAGEPLPLAQSSQLFRSRGSADGRVTFEDVTARSGPAFALREVGRGAAFGDLDDDGDTDVVVANNSGPVRLLRNDSGQGRAWIGLRLVVPLSGGAVRDAWGAAATVETADGRRLMRRIGGMASYASASDPRLLFGLGEGDPAVRRVEIFWPDGRREVWRDLPTRRYSTLRQGDGEPVAGVTQ